MLAILIFLKGAIIGFVIAAPVGAIGVLCIQRSFQHGFEAGFTTGIGAALADTVYGAIAAFSITGILHFLMDNRNYIKFFGGVFLLILGIAIFRKPGRKVTDKQVANNHWNNIGITFLLTLTNPTTIFSFLGIFAVLGLGVTHSNFNYTLLLIFGVFAGSLAWWVILSGCVSYFHKTITSKTLHRINQCSGGLIIAFGVGCLLAII